MAPANRAGDGKWPPGCGEPPRAIAHIRVLFSDLVKGG
jgi:hypothetical protein